MDIDPNHHPDVVHDLNQVPWPFQDNQFTEVVGIHVLEHLDDISKTVKELYRICRPQGVIRIQVPHFSCWQANVPHHKLRFSYFSFDNYLEGATGGVRQHWIFHDQRFLLRKREVTFHRAFRQFQLHRLFNRFPLTYERFWTYLFPAEHLNFELQPVKLTKL